MTDIWGFLLQTLTASGAAALLLAVKWMFRDKLSPRWQFAMWGILALMLLLPAGWGGRYALFDWPLAVEWAKSALTGEFGTLTRVAAPIPLPSLAAPETLWDWLYLVYLAGVALLLARYVASYVRLRLALGRGRRVQGEHVRAVGAEYGLPVCPAVEVDGLPTAFICGVFRPVLALPAGVETDGKVILHELLHLKHKDVAWGWVIAFFRCLHWCNPLLWLCADWAGNDLESLCDQRVLERLEGEDRRDYGRILLSMADEKYARTPGTSSAANGGRNIRRRIEAIARFKRYPAGMALASVCVALVLAVPLAAGTRAEGPKRWSTTNTMVMASARTTWCTTYAGAFDAYAKALLTGEVSYRAMCAPLSQQNELAEAGKGYNRDITWLWNQAGDVRSQPDLQQGYDIYNLTPTRDGAWEGFLVLTLNYTPDDAVEWADWDGTTATRWLAVQKLRAEQEGGRWVIVPLDELRAVQGDQRSGGNLGLPAKVYEAEYGDFLIHLQWQTISSVDSCTSSGGFWSYSVFDTTPKPHGTFEKAQQNQMTWAQYTGSPADKEKYTQIGISTSPISGDGSGPDLGHPMPGSNNGGGSSNGADWSNKILEEGWEDWIFLSGSGNGYYGPEAESHRFPSAYRAELYLNGVKAAELTLLPVEGGGWIDK